MLFDDASGAWALSNFRVNSSRTIEVVEPIRAAEVETIFRGLKKTELGFTVARPWNSLKEALKQVVLHEVDVPTSGVLQVEVANPGGGTSTFYLDAKQAGCVGTHHGRRTFHEYTIIGGAFRQTPSRG